MSHILKRIRDILSTKFARGEEEDTQSLKLRIFDQETMNDTASAIKTIGDKMNAGDDGVVVAGIVSGLIDQHRYLQSKTIGALIWALCEFATLPEDQFVDARNLYAHKLCQKMRECFADDFCWKDR